jgi:hypothetical protein
MAPMAQPLVAIIVPVDYGHHLQYLNKYALR